MNRKVKFIVSGAAILGAMAFLFFIGLSKQGSFVYYLTVGEYLEKGASKGENFRINGIVLDGSIQRSVLGQEITFRMTDRVSNPYQPGTSGSGHEASRKLLTVRYHGSVPDTFIDGADVVVEGKMSPDGVFVAHTLLAKCPSKYESAEK
ncbi:MAG: cytochrome c maturation protein CcmE [Acidobacteriota bacterium]